ncbi:hypothetical protein JNW90_24090 [Micromonospora sp. STR1s_5]|nr:hypothetical protein [Micromonospora sp. STR1s_5]
MWSASSESTTVLVLGLTAGLLVTAGCTPETEPTRAEKPVQATTAAPSPTPDVRGELVAGLQRSQGVAHRYAVRGGLPEGQKVSGTGAFDPKKRRFQSTVSVTGGKDPSAGSRIVIGTDSHVRPDQGWITSIKVELSPSDGPKLTMTTAMKDHGKSLKINAPARAGEAADFHYRK